MLSWTVQEDDGHVVVVVRGHLDLASSPGLLTALRKCLAEQPEAVLVELDDGPAVLPSIRDQLFPIAGAVRHARNLATEACLTWELPQLVGPAALVASELVSNAVEHAGTTITLEFRRRPRHVHVIVRDGSPGEPVPRDPGVQAERGRGLMLVNSIAAHWGWLPTRDGKVVWAALAV
ncbi:ATP-binding protein [Paractinoplanes toevensis]|uniref:Histidine kinase/HSP90-like ATPase domain-containing protein n=1 Tax=Paractinoplanes toevensis TaxID=571911 RepID=A0A919T873_9ACTN|nr:ATP-binding protein [Actinoplanes toevensis]GIM90923.1 hypothetical protein Ato02nite_027160 [Actinoplanes toevensis]